MMDTGVYVFEILFWVCKFEVLCYLFILLIYKYLRIYYVLDVKLGIGV